MNVTVMYSVDRNWRTKKAEICRLAQQLHGSEVGLGAHQGTCDVMFDFAESIDALNFLRAIREEYPDAGALANQRLPELAEIGPQARP